jgi:hypothetical protein
VYKKIMAFIEENKEKWNPLVIENSL